MGAFKHSTCTHHHRLWSLVGLNPPFVRYVQNTKKLFLPHLNTEKINKCDWKRTEQTILKHLNRNSCKISEVLVQKKKEKKKFEEVGIIDFFVCLFRIIPAD
jgi:hypothetical protein